MRTEKYIAEDLGKLLTERKMATMDELKHAMGTRAPATVFRKLKKLAYRTSYSHNGSYYTLDAVADFDELGIWSYRSVCFSVFGNLLSTAEAFVLSSEAGYYAVELESALEVGVKDALLTLVKRKRLAREKLSNRFLYCSPDLDKRKQQLALRRALESEPVQGRLPMGEIHDELKAAIILFYCLLDEQQRRLFAGLESLKWGHGGDRKVADLLGLDVGTVARGRRQLVAQDVEVDRARKAGGGRKQAVKKTRRSSRKSKS